ncbi:MAG: putative ABC transport system permease protein [Planctomycetota bacterium]|jgi:putative ABC transport system permease protein
MKRDLIGLALGALLGHRQRTMLSVLGIAIGVAAVVLLTSMGEGTRRYISAEFSQFGTHIIGINPGKAETFGIPGMMGGTTQKLTLDDAIAIGRVHGIERIVPLVIGQGRVEAGGRARSVNIFGVTSEMPELWKFKLGIGSFFPEGDWHRESQTCVLGAKVSRELFPDGNPLGQFVRVADRRLRVIGVMAPRGRVLGQDIDDVAYLPTATAMTLFNKGELSEINVEYAASANTERVVADIKAILTERHAGREDYTLNTQEEMLSVFGDVMDVVTFSVGAIGGISLLVGAVGILTMMWISVGERTEEIGLLKALGASSRDVLEVFMAEAMVLGTVGGAAGVGIGLSGVGIARLAMPELPLGTPPEYLLAALAISLLTGIVSGVMPASRAARMDPIEALRAE